MRKFLVAFTCLVLLSGCAPYKVIRGTKPPVGRGYVVLRDGVMLPEYTIGEGGVAPEDAVLAKERFRRRKKTVELYYKKMGVIENRFKENVPDRLGYTLGIAGSVFTLPVRTVKSYRYTYDQKYRDRIDKMQKESEALDNTRRALLREELKEYVAKDLEEEKARNK